MANCGPAIIVAILIMVIMVELVFIWYPVANNNLLQLRLKQPQKTTKTRVQEKKNEQNLSFF